MLLHLRAAAGYRGRLARDLGYLLIPLVAGIILSAVASELVISHPHARLDAGEVATLAAGPALYLLGSVAFKVRVYRDLWQPRAVAFVVVIAAASLGASLPALAIWALMLAALVGVALAEARREAPVRAFGPRPEASG
jgi:low temperature requirement protein LtrA